MASLKWKAMTFFDLRPRQFSWSEFHDSEPPPPKKKRRSKVAIDSKQALLNQTEETTVQELTLDIICIILVILNCIQRKPFQQTQS